VNRIGNAFFQGKKFWRKSATFIMLIVFLIILLGVFFRGSGVAYADELHHVISHSATSITQGEKADDLVVIGNDVHVAGTVTDNLIVINGTAYLSSTARVESIVDIGGQIRKEPGAQLNHAFILTFNHPLLNSTVLGGALIAFLTGLQLTLSAVVVLVPVVLSILMRPWLQMPSIYLQKSVRRMGAIGLLATIATIAVAGGLSATIIGIPVAALICFLYLVVGLIGLTHVAVYIGRSLLDAFTKQKQPWMQSLIGATLIMAFANIPVIGALIFLCVWIVGVGTSTTWLWRIRTDINKKFKQKKSGSE